MRLQVGLALVALLGASSASAQGYGTFSPDKKPLAGGQHSPSLGSVYGGMSSGSTSGYGGSTATRPKIYGAPEAPASPGFKPYQGSSVYSSKPATSYGAKPCETSVYVNACDKRR